MEAKITRALTRFFLAWLGLGSVLVPSGAAAEKVKAVELITIDADRKVDQDIIVQPRQKLLIKPGVTLKFAPNTGIIATGVIEARGSQDQPIRFTAQDPARGWNNISLAGPGARGSKFLWCRFSQGRGKKLKFNQQGKLLKFVKEPDQPGLVCGGAIFMYMVDQAEIKYCLFEQNSAHWGGAICLWGKSSPAISKSCFRHNRGGEDAGAIHCVLGSNPVITANHISGNQAKYGGAIHCLHGSKPTVSGNFISQNRASGSGGGFSCYNASPVISGNYIGECRAEKDGGGIAAVFNSKPTVSGNYIGGNTDQSGAGKGLYARQKPGPEKADASTCTETAAQTKAEIEKSLKKAGVLDLPGLFE